ncbi:MAG TPA: class I SAM-dependent methyltransferase [Burkholderiales bacterium]|jgi:SAM-dependent methyltransferase|nr:class I SAM-dependent methyltransferase [Burkholderiales bacterium]
MDANNRRYCIKPDYQPNLAAGAGRGGAPYWTPERIRLATRFQYDVYRIAAGLLSEPGVSSVLDVGSGPPAKLASLLPAKPLAIHLVDQAEAAPFAAQMLPAASFTAADLETIDADLGRRFDLVIFADVVEHLRNPDPCLEFIRRHLSPQGRLLISTPERDILRGRDCRACPHPEHVREWNSDEFGRFLESRGWRIVERGKVPARRTLAPLRLLGATLDGAGLAPAWYSCQFALCRPS